MPTSNDMRKVLDIQDKNIIFEDDCVEYGQFKGKKCKFIKGRLTYIPQECMKCHAANEHYTIYRNGTQVSRITLPMSGVHPTYLLLKKQRFKCKGCGATFTAKTPLLKENCFISNPVKAQILDKSSMAQSIKDISSQTRVSSATTQRVINEQAKNYKPHYFWLSKHLSFDEFKYANSTMAFEYVDAEKGTIIDILPSRDSRTIKDHFLSRYSLKARKKVETITVDMNASYVNFIPVLFPNAKIIIDRFHIVQLINRSLNRTRVTVMNQFHTSNGEDMKKYRRLKRFWKKILKKESELSYTKYTYYALFGLRLESAIVDEMLGYNTILRETYEVYQAILKAVEKNDYDELVKILEKDYPLISKPMKTSLKTLKKHIKHIKNTFVYKYSNGKIEGINNKIKVLNRVAYGYRNFANYKNRILLHFNMKPATNKQKEKTLFTAA